MKSRFIQEKRSLVEFCGLINEVAKMKNKIKELNECLTEKWKYIMPLELFHDGGRYDIETNPLICSANQWTSFYMITASVMKELNILPT